MNKKYIKLNQLNIEDIHVENEFNNLLKVVIIGLALLNLFFCITIFLPESFILSTTMGDRSNVWSNGFYTSEQKTDTNQNSEKINYL